REAAGGVRGSYGAARAAYRDRTGGAGVDARNELRELDEVASVQGQVYDLLAVDDFADDAVLRLKLCATLGRLDGDGLADLAGGHGELKPLHLASVEDDAVGALALEPARFHADGVGARGERGERV